MASLVKENARTALLEAEILYLCADLGTDVLARAITVIDALHQRQDTRDAYPLALDDAFQLINTCGHA
jgi:hypothetical protein